MRIPLKQLDGTGLTNGYVLTVSSGVIVASPSAGGAQSPWTGNIDAAGHNLTDVLALVLNDSGYLQAPILTVGLAPNIKSIASGAGDPEGSYTAVAGSLYLRDNGNVYYKSTVGGNTGWLQVAAVGGGAGWVDDGTTVRLSTVGDGVGLGVTTIDAATKFEVQGDATREDVLMSADDTDTARCWIGHTSSAPIQIGLGNLQFFYGDPVYASIQIDNGPSVEFSYTGLYGPVSDGSWPGGPVICGGGDGLTGQPGGDAYFQAGNGDSGTNGGTCYVSAGNAGAQGGTPGDLNMEAGHVESNVGTQNGGNVALLSGLPFDGDGQFSGDVVIGTASTEGFSAAESTGGLFLGSGPAAGASGDCRLTSGNAAGDDQQSGNNVITTGDATGAGEAGGSSGDIVFSTGTATGSRGSIKVGVDIDQPIQYFGVNGAAQQTVTGSRTANAALASLITALATYGLIVDSTSV